MADINNAPVPDIKRPRGRVPEWALWGIAAAAVAVFGMTAIYIKSQRKEEPPRQTIITSSDIPDEFFRTPEKPKEDAESKAEAAKAAAAAAQAAAAKAPPLVQVAPQRVSAKELFSVVPLTVAPLPPDPSEQINEARRSAIGTTRIAKAGRMVDPNEWINSQEDWDDEEKTEASYPTDLSRVVTATRFIPALLVNAINSELAGKVVATIEENVYGGHNRFVLIPAGSQAVGRYKALAKPGDERIMVIWERIITPEGVNMHVANADMTDAMGRSGITGDVDNRFFDRYGMALLVSTISALTAYQIPVSNTGQQVVVQTYGSNISSLSNQILEKNINLKPKISLPPGQRILISPQRDIWFKKPERKEMTLIALDQPSQRGGKK